MTMVLLAFGIVALAFMAYVALMVGALLIDAKSLEQDRRDLEARRFYTQRDNAQFRIVHGRPHDPRMAEDHD